MTLVLKSIFNLPNTDIRISAFLPPLLGLLWGLPGALGIAIGNLISDLYSDFAQTATAEDFLFGFIANFLIAYLPYKIWYTIKVDKDTSRFNLHVHNLINLRRRTRIGMGTCQAELCACRASCVLCQVGNNKPEEELADLKSFMQERWKGMQPVAWGDTLKENQLTLKIYQELCGLNA